MSEETISPEAVLDGPKTEAPVTVQPPQIQLNVEPGIAMNLTVQEFDKRIAAVEADVAELKKQKAAYIYDTNVNALIAQAKQQQAAANAAQVAEAKGTEG